MHRLSASKIGLARHCLYFARGDVPHPESESSREANFGTVEHNAFANTIEHGERMEPDYEQFEDVDVDRGARVYDNWYLWWTSGGDQGLKWQTEQPVAWNVRTGVARWLVPGKHRDYKVSDDEIPGTLDAVAYADGVVHVIDWKTGRAPVEDPATNPQLAHNAAAAMAALGAGKGVVKYVKTLEHEVYAPEPHTVDSMAASAFQDELLGMLEAIPTSKPNPGPWCSNMWCPARGACPATAKQVDAVIDAAAIVKHHRPVSLTLEDNDHAAEALGAISGVEQFISELKKRLREYAELHGGITLADGTVWSKTEVTTERPDLTVDGALGVLYEMGLTKAVENKVTWAAVKKLGGAKVEKELRERLRAMGATKSSVAPRFEAREKKA